MSDVALDWIISRDTGLSSKAIWAHMMGRNPEDRVWGVWYPLDPDDFGRCYRLLALIPEWRPRIAEMAKYGAVWAALAARWDEVEALYVEEVVNVRAPRMAPKTYALMREIVDAARAAGSS